MFIRAARSTLAGLCLVGAGCVGPSPATSEATVAEPLGASGVGSYIIVMNGLSPRSLADNALLTHPDTPRMLVSRPLVDASLANRNELLGRALHDPNAREVFKKIVTCAMPPEVQIHWRDPFHPSTLYTFDGQLGLASGWRSKVSGATEHEQEVVSACVLMLMNDAGYQIPVSPRGHAADGRRIDANVDARIWPYNDRGVPDARFAECASGASAGARECGWDPVQSYIGTCVGNASTGAPWGVVGVGGTVEAGGPEIGSGSGARILRVCDGLQPCAPGSPGAIEVDDAQQVAPYQCHSPGDGHGQGWFAAMTGPYVAGDSFTATPATTMAGAVFPARAVEVYHVPEAAWFGSVFTGVLPPGVDSVFVDPSGAVLPKIHMGLPASKGTIYPMYYCEAPGWNPTSAVVLHRLCADPDPDRPTDCVAGDVGACELHCTLPGADDQGAFADCRPTPASPAYQPLTDYLSDDCLVSRGVDDCSH